MNPRPRSRSHQGPGRAAAPPEARSPWARLRSFVSHPLIYSRMVGDVDPAARPGDIVTVYDKTDKLHGTALFNPHSQIALRMLQAGAAPFTEDFWPQTLQRAIEWRRSLDLAGTTDAYRLVHAEGDGLSGLIVERYADVLAFEFFALGMYQRRALLTNQLQTLLDPPASLDRPDRAATQWRPVYRADSRIESIEGFRAQPARPGAAGDASSSEAEPPAMVTIREHGVRYRVDLATGHKTGFFCDQRDNRRQFASFCRAGTVLDLCSYSGGFGLCAKRLADAREVTSVDLDEVALAIAKENANLNQVRIDYVHADAFHYVRQMITNGRRFDAVVLDPPKLAPSREEYDDALRKYHDLNGLTMQVVRPGGVLLTCSCSGLVSRDVFVETVTRAAGRVGKTLQLFAVTGAAPDHPVMLNCPESEYLKALWFRVL